MFTEHRRNSALPQLYNLQTTGLCDVYHIAIAVLSLPADEGEVWVCMNVSWPGLQQGAYPYNGTCIAVLGHALQTERGRDVASCDLLMGRQLHRCPLGELADIQGSQQSLGPQPCSCLSSQGLLTALSIC